LSSTIWETIKEAETLNHKKLSNGGVCWIYLW
jgi:hypothetical protein